MSAFTQRLYLSWLRVNGGAGAQPQVAKRSTGRGTRTGNGNGCNPYLAAPVPCSGRFAVEHPKVSTSLPTRPEKPAVQSHSGALFLPTK